MSDDYIEPQADDPILRARLFGYSWDDINDYIDGRSQDAIQAGYSPQEVASYLGRGNPDDIQNRVAQDLQYRVSADPQFASGLKRPNESIPLTPLDEMPSARISSYAGQDTPPEVSPFAPIEPAPEAAGFDEHARQSYASALLRGEAQSPRDFAERYAGALWQAVPDADPGALARTADNLVSTLPSDQEFTDAAIAVAKSQSVELTPDNVNYIKNGVVDEWSSTGDDLMDIYRKAQTDPNFADKLTTPEPEDSPWWAAFAHDPEAETAAAASEAMRPVIEQGISDWWTWRINQVEENAKDQLSWEDLKKGVTPEQLMADPAFGMAMGLVGGPIAEVGPRASALVKMIPELHPSEAGALFDQVARVMREMPEPKVHVIDPAVVGPNAEIPASRALEPPPIAAKVEPKPAIEGAPAEPVSPLEFAPEAAPASKIQALGQEWLDNRAGVLEDLRIRNEGVIPDEFGPNFFRQLAAKQDAATLELADGMDSARGFLKYLTDLGGDLLRDESGALNIFKTPAQRTVREGFVEARDYAQPLMIRGMGTVTRRLANYADMFNRYPTGSTNWFGNPKFQNLYKLVSPHLPEWEAEIAKGPMGNPMATKVGDMIKYVEGRSNGYTMQPDNPLAPLADTIRAVNQSTRKLMEDAQARGLHNLQSYYEDYYRHIWKDPTKADQIFGVPSQGSSRSFKLRSIPTIEDGLARGLEPKYTNPIDLTLADAAEKVRYLQTLDMIDAATQSKTLMGNPFVYFASKPLDNDIPLVGVGTKRDVAAAPTVAQQKAVVDARATRDALNAQIRAAGGVNNVPPSLLAQRQAARQAVNAAEQAAAPKIIPRQAYANPGFANNWNDMLSKGFFSRDFSGKVFDNLNYIKNVATQYQLMFPAFHAQTMAMETLAGGFGNAFTEAGAALRLTMQGQGARAAAEAGHSALDFAKSASGYKFFETLVQGHRGITAYREMAANPVINLLTEANARFGDRVQTYRFGSAPSLWESYQKGQIGQEYRESFRRLIGDKSEPLDYRLAQIPLRRMWSFAAHETARLLNTATGPLFDFVIPRLKIGANMEGMQTYLRENPAATYEAKIARARQIVNNTDDRMGEMQMDNIFWPKAVKQAAQLSMISPGWVYGSIRFFTSAAGVNLERRAFEWNPVATSKFMGLVTAYTLQNSITQYFMTGKLPWNSDTPIQDMFIGGTTGAIIQGAKERLLQPGQQKELFDYGKIIAHAIHDPMTTFSALADFAAGKMPGIWQLLRGLVTGHDAIGHDIAHMPGGWGAFFAKSLLTPIFTGAFAQRKQGTGISEWQTLIGWREVPMYAQNPEHFYHGLEVADAIHAREERSRAIAENRIYEQQREVPDAVPQPGRSGGTSEPGAGYRSIRRPGGGGYADSATLDANGLPAPAARGGGQRASSGYRSLRSFRGDTGGESSVPTSRSALSPRGTSRGRSVGNARVLQGGAPARGYRAPRRRTR